MIFYCANCLEYILTRVNSVIKTVVQVPPEPTTAITRSSQDMYIFIDKSHIGLVQTFNLLNAMCEYNHGTIFIPSLNVMKKR